MPFPKIFKRKEKKEIKPKEKFVEVEPRQMEETKEVRPLKVKKTTTHRPSSRGRAPAKVGEAYRILKTPHVTEKATDLAGKNQYVFKIWPRANKVEVKKVVGEVFGVDVISVKIVNVPKKKRRLGRIEGFRKGYKKAIVKIKEGQKIEVLPR